MLTKLPEPVRASDLPQPDEAAAPACAPSPAAPDSSPVEPSPAPEPTHPPQARAPSLRRTYGINPEAKKARWLKRQAKDQTVQRREYHRNRYLKAKAAAKEAEARRKAAQDIVAAATLPTPLDLKATSPEQVKEMAKLGVDHRLPALINAVVHHRISVNDAAVSLGMTYPEAKLLLQRAKAHAKPAKIDWMLDTVATPAAAALLIDKIVEGDRTSALEVLKGRGHLRSYGTVKQEGAPTQVALAVKIDMAGAKGELVIPEGAIVGVPNRAEVTEADDASTVRSDA